MNPAHTGSISGVGVTPPLHVRWATRLPAGVVYEGEGISYPVIADGRVFVAVRGQDPDNDPAVYALDGASGTVLWSKTFPEGRMWSALAYDNGRLFVALYGDPGGIKALNPADGSVLWSASLGGFATISAAPAAANGAVYVVATNQLVAYRQSDGHMLWSTAFDNFGGSPAVDGDRVYAVGINSTLAFAASNGSVLWSVDPGDPSGGEGATAAYGGRVYARFHSDGVVHSPTDGAVTGSFPGGHAIALDGDVGLFPSPPYLAPGATIFGRSLGSGAELWRFTGDNYLTIAPAVIDGYGYAGSSSGWLYALDLRTGAPAWCTNLGIGLPVTDEHNASSPPAGFGAGEGMLVFPAHDYVVAMESGGAGGCPDSLSAPSQIGPHGETVTPSGYPTSGGTTTTGTPGGPSLTLSAKKAELWYSQVASLSGQLQGVAAPGGQQVQLEADPFPYGEFKPLKPTTTSADGSFRFRTKPTRNTLYRVKAAGVVSGSVQEFVDLAALFRREIRSAHTFREHVQYSGPRDVPYKGRRLQFYVGRHGAKSVRLVASRRLRQIRPGRFRASAPFRVTGNPRRYVVVTCVREKTPDAWGMADPLDPVCGRRRLPIAV